MQSHLLMYVHTRKLAEISMYKIYIIIHLCHPPPGLTMTEQIVRTDSPEVNESSDFIILDLSSSHLEEIKLPYKEMSNSRYIDPAMNFKMSIT